MPNIGENRLAIYNLLYTHPLYNYINEKNELNVLLLGNGWVGNEAFKAIFWCGQYPDVQLNITIASQDAEAYKDRLLKYLPALKDYTNLGGKDDHKNYANVRIKNVSFDTVNNGGLTDEFCGADCLNLSAQNYILVAVGDSDTNGALAYEMQDRLGADHKALVVVNGSDLPENEGNLEFVNFAYNYDACQELLDLARTTHFDYSSAKNPSANRQKTNQEFDDILDEEILQAQNPEDFDDTIQCFLGGNYNADSSIASSLHIPYKVHYCNPTGDDDAQLKSLVAAINERNEQYWTLAEWEHKRWVAYMIIRGYRGPTDAELQQICDADSGNRIDSKRVHSCICEHSPKGIALTPTSNLWNTDVSIDPSEWNNLSELEQLALTLHRARAARYKTDPVIRQKLENLKNTVTTLETNIGLNCNIIKNSFLSMCYNLLDDEYSVWVPFKNVKDGTLAEINKNDQLAQYSQDKADLKAQIEDIHGALAHVLNNNKRENFVDYDLALIDSIPGKLMANLKNLTVATFIDNYRPDAAITPWLLLAAKAEFYFASRISKKTFDNAKTAIENFFKKHGENTTPTCVLLKQGFQKTLCNLENRKNAGENVLINVLDRCDAFTMYEVSQFSNNLTIVSFNRFRGLHFFNNDLQLNKKHNANMTVNDLASLFPAEIPASEHTKVMLYVKCNELAPFFWNTASVSPWPNQHAVLERPRADKKNSPSHFNSKVLEAKFNSPHAQNYLQELMQMGVIGPYVSSYLGLVPQSNGPDKEMVQLSYPILDKDFFEALSDKQGNLFEMLVYYAMLYSNLFDDVIPSAALTWGDKGTAKNELDVVATKGATPILVSCKTNQKIEPSFIYEIASEAEQFNAIPVLAVAHDLKNATSNTAVERAKATGVALLDIHILRDPALLKHAFQLIMKGSYPGPVDFTLPQTTN